MSITVEIPEKVRVLTRYSIDDPEYLSDYCAVEVYFDNDSVPYFMYSNSYHGKGKERVQGIIECLKFLASDNPDQIEFVYENVADYED